MSYKFPEHPSASPEKDLSGTVNQPFKLIKFDPLKSFEFFLKKEEEKKPKKNKKRVKSKLSKLKMVSEEKSSEVSTALTCDSQKAGRNLSEVSPKKDYRTGVSLMNSHYKVLADTSNEDEDFSKIFVTMKTNPNFEKDYMKNYKRSLSESSKCRNPYGYDVNTTCKDVHQGYRFGLSSQISTSSNSSF